LMNILAFDCCFGACSVAVLWQSKRGEQLLREEYREHDAAAPADTQGRAEALLPMLDGVMAAAKLEYAQLDRMAVTLGPGSFTGVRVGLAAARGIALAADVPVVGTTSLLVIAHRADIAMLNNRMGPPRAGASMVVAMDARQGHVYLQQFGASVAEPMGEAMLVRPEEIATTLAASGPIVAVGTGATALAHHIEQAGGTVRTVLPKLEPHARFLAMLAPALPVLPEPAPLYLRAPDAKPQGDKSLPRSVQPQAT
jgi:tRNA threonylcarbamoyladenosine biosynthesis protein TsaB